MHFNKRFLQVVSAGLLILFPVSLFAAAAQVGGTASRSAIDTLTVSDNAIFGKVLVNTGRIIFQTDSLASAAATRDRIVFLGSGQLDCRLFRIQSLGSDRFQINATGGRTVISIKLNGTEVPAGIGDSSKAGQLFRREDANQNPQLPACGTMPSLSFYGLVVLAFILAAAAAWVFRRREISTEDLA